MNEMNENIISFSYGYGIYKFIESISNLVDVVRMEIKDNKIEIKVIDISRISLTKINFYITDDSENVNINLPHNIDVLVNLDDLKNLLKTRKGDNKSVELHFPVYKPYDMKMKPTSAMTVIKEGKYGKITKTLNYVEVMDIEDVPMEALESKKYTNIIGIIGEILDDYFYESGDYAEVMDIRLDDDGVHLSENGVIGNCDYHINTDILTKYERENEANSSYSLTFLNIIRDLLCILKTDSVVTLYLETDTPLKITIDMTLIGTKLTMYLAPRVKEPDLDDDW